MKTKAPPKTDLYKLHAAEYAAKRKPALIQLGPGRYLAIDGKGAPGGPLFVARIGALYGMAFTVKMTRKFAGLQDYAISKLEALWWSDAGLEFQSVPKENWCWTLLIRTPEFISTDELTPAVDVLLKRGKEADVRQVRLEVLTEGTCVQMLHVGPYESEPETIREMRAFAESRQLQFQGKHHEIYLSDPRRVVAERLKTILRIPVSPAAG